MQKPARLAWALIAIGSTGFALTTLSVGSAWLFVIDQFTGTLFRQAGDSSNALGPAWLEEVVADFSTLGGYPIMAAATLFTFVSLVDGI